ncbi:DUF4783 domain-containing protein [Neolewinella antarctica]|uniref:DUF4783 domain-containing protein n=1 Tax=Neolewinella antarctica TaxID=442734 RepID=A0ABX0XAE3_9BACT|nr:DUF4783 domain-containing protein [Neolewinella antarctica]NJC25788.1 hypothetical protein [Neolewinella antarctica]
MKTLLILLSGLFVSSSVGIAQKPASLEEVCAAVGAAKVESLVAAIGDDLELSILDNEAVYSRADAATALKKFFAGFTKTSFGKVHQGASKADDAEYCIGTLTTDKGSFRVYIYVAKKGPGIVLEELRFDPS